jgi:predicted transcriptional regulator
MSNFEGFVFYTSIKRSISRVNLQEAVASRLVDILHQQGMTRYALCKKIAMSETTVYNIIKGTCKSINLDTCTLFRRGWELAS